MFTGNENSRKIYDQVKTGFDSRANEAAAAFLNIPVLPITSFPWGIAAITSPASRNTNASDPYEGGVDAIEAGAMAFRKGFKR
jgi:hypothetical protein